jgi:hypothetical protein
MSDLSFEVAGARCEPYAASPTLLLRLRIREGSGRAIHSISLRAQVQIDPRRRPYSGEEADLLPDLFGPRERWAETLRSLVWAHVSVMVPGFVGTTEVDLPLPCTYDFEVGAAKYLLALQDGDIPLHLLFSGSVFAEEDRALRVDLIPWEKEATFQLPVPVWREVMDRYFPGTAWMKVSRDTLAALQRYKGRMALASWDEVIETLLERVSDPEKEEKPA